MVKLTKIKLDAKVKELTMSHGDDGPTIDCSGDALGVERPR